MRRMDSPLAIGAFTIGATQLLKKAGVSGNWLILVCVLAGGLASYMTAYQPELWAKLSELLVALTATGLVSFTDDRLKALK